MLMHMEGKIEESGGRRRIIIPMRDKIMEFEKKMLCNSACPYILPMFFLNTDGTSQICYDFTGYVQLKESVGTRISEEFSAIERPEMVFDALNILSGMLRTIKGLENYLIFPERITIHTDCIFIDPDSGRVAVAFYPDGRSESTVQSRILTLIDDLSKLYGTDEVDRYLMALKDNFKRTNPGLDGMLRLLGNMQREISYIYGRPKNSRNEEGVEAFYDGAADGTEQNGVCGKAGANRMKMIKAAIFLILTAGLIAVFMSAGLEIPQFVGSTVVVVGIVLSLMRRRQHKIKGRSECPPFQK